MSGTVAEVGDGVEGFHPGDEVVVRPLDPRGETPADRGFSHISRNLKFLGIDAPGALQRSWTVPAFTLHALPAGSTCAWARSPSRWRSPATTSVAARSATGQMAVVIGGGPIGLLIALVARARGARVLVVEPDADASRARGGARARRARSRRRRRRGRVSRRARAPAPTSCSRSPARPPASSRRPEYAGLRGRIVVVAIFPEPKPVALFDVFWKELDIRGVRVYEPEDFEAAIELLAAGSLDARAADHRRRAARARAGGVRGAPRGPAGDEDPGRLPRVNAAPFDLSGRTALVTGCRRGIGRAAAVALAARRCGHRRRERLARARAARSPPPSRRTDAASRPTGATSATAPRSTSSSRRCATTCHERIDILVNNAGTIARVPAAEHPDELWDRVLEVNLTAQFILARELGRDMVDRGSGKIVFVASLLSFQGGITVPGYTASKSGVAGLTKALANEWAAHGVNVNAIAPGLHPHRQHAGAAGRRRSASSRSSSASRPAAGPSRRTSRARRLPLLAGGRLRARRRPSRRRRLARAVSARASSEQTVLAALERARCCRRRARRRRGRPRPLRGAARRRHLLRRDHVPHGGRGRGARRAAEVDGHARRRRHGPVGRAGARRRGRRRRVRRRAGDGRRRRRRLRASSDCRSSRGSRRRPRSGTPCGSAARRSRSSRPRRSAAPRSCAPSRRRSRRCGSSRPAASTRESLPSYLALPAVVACGGSWICERALDPRAPLRRDRAPRARRGGGGPMTQLLSLRPREECRYDLVALGEVMLRLDPGDGRIATARSFRAWEGGGEYNVARGPPPLLRPPHRRSSRRSPTTRSAG